MLTKSKPARQIQLLEFTSPTAGRVDKSSSTIFGVRIIGPKSANGREYTRGALLEACRMYESTKVFLDHPTKPNASRSVRDWIGVLENCRMDGDCVRGDLRLISGHPFTPMILSAAQSDSTRFGLSHNATGRSVARNGKIIVEKIESVRSVDLVECPATNEGLFESVQTKPIAKPRPPVKPARKASPAELVEQVACLRERADDAPRSPGEQLAKLRGCEHWVGAVLEMDGMADKPAIRDRKGRQIAENGKIVSPNGKPMDWAETAPASDESTDQFLQRITPPGERKPAKKPTLQEQRQQQLLQAMQTVRNR